MFSEVEQPGVGTYLMPGSPLDFTALPRVPVRPAPQLGEHTEEVLAERARARARPRSAGCTTPAPSPAPAPRSRARPERAASPLHGAARSRARLATPARALLAGAGSIRGRFRCARSARRSPSWSSTSHRYRAHRGPTPASAPREPDRAGAVRELGRRSAAAGSRQPRRRLGSDRRASGESHSERSEAGRPIGPRQGLRQRRLADRRGGHGPVPARSRRAPPRDEPRGRSGTERARAGARPAPPPPRRRDR